MIPIFFCQSADLSEAEKQYHFEKWGRPALNQYCVKCQIKAIRYDDPKLQMPPDKKLPAEVVTVFEAWINAGALDPRGEV